MPMTEQNQNPEGGKRAYFNIDFEQIDSLDAEEKVDHFKSLHQQIVAAMLGVGAEDSEVIVEAEDGNETEVSE